MLFDEDLEYVKSEANPRGIALAWVIDQEVVYTLAVNTTIADMFLNSTVEDVSVSYPEHKGVTVRFYKNDSEEVILHTSEYFGSVLLSSPVLINLLSHKYGTVILGSGERFLNNEFFVPGVDMTNLAEWPIGYEPSTGRQTELCAAFCQCDKLKA